MCWAEREVDMTDVLICLFFGRKRTGEEIGRDLRGLRTKVPQQQAASGQQIPETTV